MRVKRNVEENSKDQKMKKEKERRRKKIHHLFSHVKMKPLLNHSLTRTLVALSTLISLSSLFPTLSLSSLSYSLSLTSSDKVEEAERKGMKSRLNCVCLPHSLLSLTFKCQKVNSSVLKYIHTRHTHSTETLTEMGRRD